MLLTASPLLAQPPAGVRVQEAIGRSYFQIRLQSPDHLRLSRTQQQSLDRIALYDLARYPHLVPLDATARCLAWHFSADAKSLEFLGLGTANSSGKFRLIYPTESDDKPPKLGWKETEIIVDWSAATKVNATTAGRAKAPAEDDLEGRWAEAWARELAIRERQAIDADLIRAARQELCRQYKVADPMPRPSMAIPEGAAARTIDIKDLAPLEPMAHPWNELLAGRQTAVEPLARLIPADFYYVRMRGGEGVALLKQLQRWAKVAVGMWDGIGRDDRLAERYLRQLGLPLDEHGEFRLPSGTREAAIIGSDWHFRTGSDVTLLFALDDKQAFQQDFEAGNERLRQEYGPGLNRYKDRFEDTEIEFLGAAQGVNRYCAVLGDVAVFSNSRPAFRRVIDAFRGQVSAIADTPEFRLMRTVFRPDEPSDRVSLFVPEAFLLNQFGPRRQILQRQRLEEIRWQQALRSSSLLGAWNAGMRPGEPATFTVAPLIARDIDKISRDEDEFYQQFREKYRTEVAALIAPFAVRISALAGAVGAEAFVMSSRDADFWDGLRRHFGKGSVAREAGEFPGSALRLVASVRNGEMDWARFKNSLIKLGVDRKHLTNHFDWMGDRWTLNLNDGLALAKFVADELHVDLTATDLAVSHDTRDERWLLAQLPATLAIEIAKPLFFQGTLNKAKQIVTETFPKALAWESLPEPFRGVKLDRVQPSQALLLLAFGKLLKPEEAPSVFFANDGRTIVLAPSMEAVTTGIDREIRPNRARTPQPQRANAWLGVNLAASPELSDSLRTAIERHAHRQTLAATALWQWLYDCGALTGEESVSERDAIALRWLGFVPASLDRSEFRWDARNREVVNARHGSWRQPRLYAEPAADAVWLNTLSDFAKLRGRMDVRPDGVLGVLSIER